MVKITTKDDNDSAARMSAFVNGHQNGHFLQSRAMKTRIQVLLAAAICVLLLAACGSGRSAAVLSETFGDTAADNAPRQESERLNIGDSYELAAGLKSGSLSYTCTDAYLINNVSDIPTTGGFADYAEVVFGEVTFRDDEGYYPYPDFIKADGEFIDGAYMVLAELTVKSNDAEMYTTHDLDDEGVSMGEFEDPYLFAFHPELADTSLYFEEKDSVPRYFSKVFDYYGRMNEINVNGDTDKEWCLFRLEPGEEISYTLGYLVSSKNEGGNNDLSSLCLAYYGGTLDYNIFVDLHLTEGGE